MLIARPAEDDSRAAATGASLTVSGDGSADHHDVALASNTRGTLRFLSTALIYDAMCTRIEATSGADAKEAAETAEPRARLVASVKGVLASVCALDEERQFELFQLVASLEARYVPVSPARMGGITHAAGTLLFRRALEDYMRKAGMIEADGEKAIELCSVVQELPQRRAILLLVTNRALYLLRPAAACSVCPPWRLCPNPPKLVRRFVHSRFSRLVIDHSAPFQAGHRFRLYLHSHKWARAGGKRPPTARRRPSSSSRPSASASPAAPLDDRPPPPALVEVEVTPLGMMLAHAITEHTARGSSCRGALSVGGGGSGREDSLAAIFQRLDFDGDGTVTKATPARPAAPPRRARTAPPRPRARAAAPSLYPRRRFKTGYPSTRRGRNSAVLRVHVEAMPRSPTPTSRPPTPPPPARSPVARAQPQLLMRCVWWLSDAAEEGSHAAPPPAARRGATRRSAARAAGRAAPSAAAAAAAAVAAARHTWARWSSPTSTCCSSTSAQSSSRCPPPT